MPKIVTCDFFITFADQRIGYASVLIFILLYFKKFFIWEFRIGIVQMLVGQKPNLSVAAAAGAGTKSSAVVSARRRGGHQLPRFQNERKQFIVIIHILLNKQIQIQSRRRRQCRPL
ncbi:hypothetical protein SDC9_183878 [bioreactor metagenome]|uniref:Uncharacterized protein n=1 Tax=bioreactor metagenome TaxID=1076179 RepID=A0A645HE09_9ZZZZ